MRVGDVVIEDDMTGPLRRLGLLVEDKMFKGGQVWADVVAVTAGVTRLEERLVAVTSRAEAAEADWKAAEAALKELAK